MVSRLIPMKRELKAERPFSELHLVVRVSRLIPMKRELKVRVCAWYHDPWPVSRLIPMKRELKGDTALGHLPHAQRFKD